MSWAATKWAQDQVAGGPMAKLLLLATANYSDAEGGCIVSQARLARDTEMSVKTVERWLAEFEARGVIRRERRYRKDGKRATDRIILTAFAAGDSGSAGGGAAGGSGGDEKPVKKAPEKGGDDGNAAPVAAAESSDGLPDTVSGGLPDTVSGGLPDSLSATTRQRVGAYPLLEPRSYSDPSDRDADPPKAAPVRDGGIWKKVLFADCLPRLATLTGQGERATRKLVGKWLAETGDDARPVCEAIEEALADPPAHAVSWISARLVGPGKAAAQLPGYLELKRLDEEKAAAKSNQEARP